MGLNHLPELAKQLLNNGSEPSVPVQIWSKISQNNQRSYSTILGEVEVFLRKNFPDTPSVIVIGKNAISI
jgi:siroheme synthase